MIAGEILSRTTGYGTLFSLLKTDWFHGIIPLSRKGIIYEVNVNNMKWIIQANHIRPYRREERDDVNKKSMSLNMLVDR